MVDRKFIRTSSHEHVANVTQMWERLEKGGFIKKGTFSGWYNVQDEAYVSDVLVKDGR